MLLMHIEPGEKVAILPWSTSPPQDTMDIGTVAFVDDQVVRLTDDRMYSRHTRCGLTFRSRGYIQPASIAHHAAVGWTAVEA
jgi:hypothetical protein